MLKAYESVDSASFGKLPHMIVSEIEHDSVKLIAESYEKLGFAGIHTHKKTSNLNTQKFFFLTLLVALF